jgi:hypothetical protein
MNEVNITVQICCLKPSWVSYEKNKYRLYINDEMLVERSWIWNINTVINEDIWVDLTPTTINSVRIESILDPVESTAKFSLMNLKVNNNPIVDYSEQSELSFTI